jgi:hypothetical protein
MPPGSAPSSLCVRDAVRIFNATLAGVTLDTSRTISLRFSEADYVKLREEAATLGLKPAVLARVIVRTSLNSPHDGPRRSSRRRFAAALEGLNHLVASGGGAPVDAVEVIHAVRRQRNHHLAQVPSPTTLAE